MSGPGPVSRVGRLVSDGGTSKVDDLLAELRESRPDLAIRRIGHEWVALPAGTRFASSPSLAGLAATLAADWLPPDDDDPSRPQTREAAP